jgi:hypothetical protein
LRLLWTLLQAAGYAKVEGVTGEVFLGTLGFDPSATTQDIAILCGFYAGFVLMCIALFYWRLPRTTSTKRRPLRRFRFW